MAWRRGGGGGSSPQETSLPEMAQIRLLRSVLFTHARDLGKPATAPTGGGAARGRSGRRRARVGWSSWARCRRWVRESGDGGQQPAAAGGPTRGPAGMVDVEDVVVLAPGPATPAAPAGTHAGDAAPVAVPTVLKALETLVPVSATVSMQTAAIRARTSAYSTSVAPRSRRAMRLGVAVGRGAITFGFGTDSNRVQALCERCHPVEVPPPGVLSHMV